MKITENVEIKNDIKHADKHKTYDLIETYADYSISYFVLLALSGIITTLGLLVDASPIVIGGMIIAPLMWPILKVTVGMTTGRKSFITSSLGLFAISFVITLLSAFAITLLSPVKSITREISLRTQPTLIDIFIALSAGAVAALALGQKRVSSNLAGVAVATSLMPPLCVGGIGLALGDYEMASKSLLLFFANVISIIFISTIVFRITGLKGYAHKELRRSSLFVVSAMLVITAIPLFFFLKNYTYRTQVYQTAERVLKNSFEDISSEIKIENMNTELTKIENEQRVNVEANVLVPEGITITFEDKEEIVHELEAQLEEQVNVRLRLQKTLGVETETDAKRSQERQQIIQEFQQYFSDFEDVTIDNITLEHKDEMWAVDAILRASPKTTLSSADRENLETQLEDKLAVPVEINIEIISRLLLHSQSDVQQNEIVQKIQEYFQNNVPNVHLQSIAIEQVEDGRVVRLDVIAENTFIPSVLRGLDESLESEYKTDFRFEVNELLKRSHSLD